MRFFGWYRTALALVISSPCGLSCVLLCHKSTILWIWLQQSWRIMKIGLWSGVFLHFCPLSVKDSEFFSATILLTIDWMLKESFHFRFCRFAWHNKVGNLSVWLATRRKDQLVEIPSSSCKCYEFESFARAFTDWKLHRLQMSGKCVFLWA